MNLIKNFPKITLILVCGCLFFFTSCERGEDENDCVALANEITTTGNAYAAELSVSNCNAYRAAIEAYIEGCNNRADISSFQATLRDLNCE